MFRPPKVRNGWPMKAKPGLDADGMYVPNRPVWKNFDGSVQAGGSARE